MSKFRLHSFAFFSFAIIIALNGNLFGHASGVANTTRKDGGSGCSCHSSSSATGVAIAGPTTLNPGATAAYTVTITRSGSFNSGVDIAASAGTLAPADAVLKANSGDLTHHANNKGTNTLVYNFNYTAPTTGGVVTLYATGAGSSATKPAWNFAPDFSVNVSGDATPTIALTYPKGGESWTIGTIQNILWSSANISNVGIDFSSDNGTSWNSIIASTPATISSYAWTVPNSISSQCKIRISDASNSALLSVNASSFSVVATNPNLDPNLLFEENFDYPISDSLNGIHGGWVSHSGTGQFPPKVADFGLAYSGYINSDLGNAVQLISQGEDINKKIANAADSVVSGSVYVSFLVQVDTAKTGDYFLHLGQYAFNSVSAQRCRVYVKAASLGSSNIAFGLFKGSSTTVTNPVYTDTSSYMIGETHLIVLKYTFVPGAANDYCNMWIDPDLSGAEPAPMLTDSSYTVSDLNSASTIALRQGTWATSPSVIVDGIRFAKAWNSITAITAVKNENKQVSVTGFQLNQNYPNPFNPDTKISYNLSHAGNTQVVIYDVLGRMVQTLKNESQSAGHHELSWNAKSASGSVMPSGIYFCRVTSGSDSKVIKMILNR